MRTSQLTEAGVRPGDEVVVPAFGGEGAAVAARDLGAHPVVVDIDPRSLCMDPARAEAACTSRTTALAVVHLFGHSADLPALRQVVRRHGCALVESEPQPREISGEPPWDVLLRRRHAEYLNGRLNGVVVPATAPGAVHDYTEYVVRVPGNGRPDRDAFAQALRLRGVDCRVPVKLPLHRTAEFHAGVRLPEAERAADECLALPVDASLSRRELQRMVSACNALGGLLWEPAA